MWWLKMALCFLSLPPLVHQFNTCFILTIPLNPSASKRNSKLLSKLKPSVCRPELSSLPFLLLAFPSVIIGHLPFPGYALLSHLSKSCVCPVSFPTILFKLESNHSSLELEMDLGQTSSGFASFFNIYHYIGIMHILLEGYCSLTSRQYFFSTAWNWHNFFKQVFFNLEEIKDCMPINN